MKKIEQIYEDLKEIEQILTNAIIYHGKNPKYGRFFEDWVKVSNLKSIRFGVRMLIQSVEEIINDSQKDRGLKND